MGSKGGGNTPPDRELRNLAIPLPELRKPVQRAIGEANRQYREGQQDPWQFGRPVVQPWNPTQEEGYNAGINAARSLGDILNPSAALVSRTGAGEFIGGGPGQESLERFASGGFVGNAPGQGALNSLAGGGYVGNLPGQGALNSLAQGGYVGNQPGQALLNRFGSGEFMNNTPGQGILNTLSEGRFVNNAPGQAQLNYLAQGGFVGNAPGQAQLNTLAHGAFVGNAPGQAQLNTLAKGGFVGNAPGQEMLEKAGSGAYLGNTPGQKTLTGIGEGNFARPGVPAYDELLKRSLQGSGGIGLIQGTAGGQYLQGNPHLDALIKSQSRDITQGYGDATAMTEGRVSGAGRLGSNAEYELQKRNADSLGQQLGDLETRTRYQDYGNERAMQQQAQLALPGAFQTEIGTGLNAANARAGDEWRALETQLAGAQAGGQLYQNSLGQALGAATNAGQGYRADLGLQGQFANDAGNAYRADLGLQGQFAGQAGDAYRADIGLQGDLAQAAGQGYRADLGLQGQFANQAGNLYQNAAAQALRGAEFAGAGVRADQGLQLNAAQAAGNAFSRDQATQLAAAQAAGQGYRADQGLQFNASQAAQENYRNSINQALQGAGMAPAQAAARFMAPEALMRFGDSRHDQAQEQAQEEQAQQRYEQEAQWQNLQRWLQSLQGAAGLTNPNAGGLGINQGPQGPGTAELATGLLSSGIMAAGQSAPYWAPMLSDRRLKTDVERLGDLSTGAGLYRYRYIWDEPGTVRVGPMAQELAEVQPDAVHNVGGVLMVDMAMVEV